MRELRLEVVRLRGQNAELLAVLPSGPAPLRRTGDMN
jgi:hypothetical protein